MPVQTRSAPGTGTSGSGASAVYAAIPAPGYDATANYSNDAALLVLMTATRSLSIRLATAEPAAGTAATVYGWGDTSTAGGAGISSTTGRLVVQSNADGAAFWRTWWAPSDMSASDPGGVVALGPGDSGGPLVVNGVEVGINDRTGGAGTPSIFTRVDRLDGWIQAEIAVNAPKAPSGSVGLHIQRDVQTRKHQKHHRKHRRHDAPAPFTRAIPKRLS